jgi:putative ABC transport system ATP-binding protein
VSTARALVANPYLILADEPTGNLDSKNGENIINLLVKCQKELKRTVILVTHNPEYLPLSDTQLYIMDGKVTTSRRGQKMPEDVMNSLKTQLVKLTDMEHAK